MSNGGARRHFLEQKVGASILSRGVYQILTVEVSWLVGIFKYFEDSIAPGAVAIPASQGTCPARNMRRLDRSFHVLHSTRNARQWNMQYQNMRFAGKSLELTNT